MNKRRCLKNGGRPQAFWGALISAAASLIGTGLSISAQQKNQAQALAEQKRIQQEQEQQERAEKQAQSMNNYFATLGQENGDDIVFKCGGRRKLRNGGVRITDGGYAIPIGYDTSLLQGSTHNQLNESGKTGIGIKVGKKEIEAENGEVVQNTGNEIRVFSAQPMFGNISPAEAVLEGADEDKVFKAQETIKKRYSLKNGKSTPVGNRHKAAWGATFTTPDYIGLGVNTLGSVLSGIWANKAYRDLADGLKYEMPEFYEEHAVAGPTRYHNAAQRANVERNRLNSRRSIARNSASSLAGLERMQKVDTDALYQLNELWDIKENKENEMRMKNAEMENDIRARNAMARNQYYQTIANLKNNELAERMRLKQAAVDSNVGMIQGIGSSIGGFLQQGIDNYQADQARRMQLATSPYGSAERMSSLGVDFSPALMKTLMSDAQTRMNKFKDDTSESGIKNYNDAMDSYNYWAGLLKKPATSYTRRSLTVPTISQTPTTRRSIVTDIDDGYNYERRRWSR